MARYRGPVEKIERRFGVSLALKGERRLAGKSALDKRPYGPGQHGQRRGKISEYGIQLREKQKARMMYGVSEKQFRKTFNEASKMSGKTGVNFLKLLEVRLDNLVYRLGFASTRAQARQLVNHGHVLVNGKKVDIPSYRVKVGQTIQMKEASKNLVVVKAALEARQARAEYLSFDANTMVGSLVRTPERDEFLPEINEQLIVEFYNR